MISHHKIRGERDVRDDYGFEDPATILGTQLHKLKIQEASLEADVARRQEGLNGTLEDLKAVREQIIIYASALKKVNLL